MWTIIDDFQSNLFSPFYIDVSFPAVSSDTRPNRRLTTRDLSRSFHVHHPESKARVPAVTGDAAAGYSRPVHATLIFYSLWLKHGPQPTSFKECLSRRNIRLFRRNVSLPPISRGVSPKSVVNLGLF
jgi:hypothetical protein